MPIKKDNKTLYSTVESSMLLKVTLQTIHKYVKTEAIRCIKVGRAIYIEESELLRYLNEVPVSNSIKYTKRK
jgi:hypothetical protein